MIPDEIKKCDGIHMTPCYKKFTLILSSKKGKKETATVRRSLNQGCSSNETKKNVYPFVCQFCKQNRKQHNNNCFIPAKLTTKDGEQTIKQAAEISDPKFYFEIKGVDLIAKEFIYHIEPCHLKFSKCVRPEKEQRKKNTMNGHCKAVKKYVKEEIIEQNRAVSMTEFHELYGLEIGDCRYHDTLKKWLQENFPGQLLFLAPKPTKTEVVINSSTINAQSVTVDRQININNVAEQLRDDILSHIKNWPTTAWPPTIKDLKNADRNPPHSLVKFLTTLLSSKKHSVTRSESLSCLIESYAADIIHSVTRGNAITAKHFLPARGLHSLTGQKKVI